MKLKNLITSPSINIIVFLAYIFTFGWIISFIFLRPYLIKTEGKFDYSMDMYPGVYTFESILLKSLLVYIILIVLFLLLSKFEYLFINLRVQNYINKVVFNKFYNYFFKLGIILIFSPVIYIIIVFLYAIYLVQSYSID